MTNEEFLKKYGFTMGMTKPHPVYKDEMKFDGLEADYVSRLEQKIEHYENIIMNQKSEVDRLSRLAVYRLEDEIKAKEHEKV